MLKNRSSKQSEILPMLVVNNWIDDNGIDVFKKHTGWYLAAGGYLKTKIGKNHYFLHRLLLSPPEGMQVDHKNGNKLDNRLENLHIVTQSYNSANRPKLSNSTMKYKGISVMSNGRYCAYFRGKYIGAYDTPEEAFEGHKKAAYEYFKTPLTNVM